MNAKNNNKKRSNYRPEKGKKSKSRRDAKYDERKDASTKDESMIKDGQGSKSTNAPWFWNRGIDFNEATRVPFDKLGGQPFTVREKDTPDAMQVAFHYESLNASPAFGMAIKYKSSVGHASDYTDPVNRQFNDIYARILALRTSDLPFQQADLALFFLNYAQIGGYIHEAIRALAVSYTYSRDSVIWPQGMLKLLGFQPDSIIGKQDDLIMVLNDIITNYNSFTMPNILATGDRAFELGRNLYLDQANLNNGAQYYVFCNKGFYLYDDTPASAEDTNMLVYHNFTDWVGTDENGLMAFSNYLDTLNFILNAWRGSSDFATIRGAILNAYTKGAFSGDIIQITPAVLYEAPSIVATDDHILHTIHNIITMKTTDNNITQDPSRNVIVHEVSLDNSRTRYALEGMNFYLLGMDQFGFDSQSGDVSADMNMIGSVMMPCRSEFGSEFILIDCGIEIPDELVIGYTEYVPTQGVNTPEIVTRLTQPFGTFVSFNNPDGGINTDKLLEVMRITQLLSQFSHAPRLVLVNAAYTERLPSADGFMLRVMGRVWNVNTLTTVTPKQLTTLHQSALRSIYTPYNPK